MATVAEPKKGRRSSKPLKETNEANILAAVISQPSPTPIALPSEDSARKGNHESLSQPRSVMKTRAVSKAKQQQEQSAQSFEKELQEMQKKLQQLRLEKEQIEELLKAREETLKEEELEIRGKEQEKLQTELKKLQKMKEFKPTTTFPIVQDKELEKKEKKKGCPQMKRPSTPYILWCKDQWNEIKKTNPDAEFKETSNILGAKWKTVSAEEKKPYEEKYQAEKEAYLKVVGNEERENEAMKLLEEEQKQRTAMELLDQNLQFKQEAEKNNKKKKTKKEKDPLIPKQSMLAFLEFTNERRAALLALIAENKSVSEVANIARNEWKNMTEKQRKSYEKIAKEKFMEEMEAYKQKKEEEAASLKHDLELLMKIHKLLALQLFKKIERKEEQAASLKNDLEVLMKIHKLFALQLFKKIERKEEEAASLKNELEELMKTQKQEALQLLEKIERTENIIKKMKENGPKKKKKKQKEEKNADPNKQNNPASSFLLFSEEVRKNLLEERPGINKSTLNALISVKWKELSEEYKKIWNEKAAEAKEAYKKELEESTTNLQQ